MKPYDQQQEQKKLSVPSACVKSHTQMINAESRLDSVRWLYALSVAKYATDHDLSLKDAHATIWKYITNRHPERDSVSRRNDSQRLARAGLFLLRVAGDEAESMIRDHRHDIIAMSTLSAGEKKVNKVNKNTYLSKCLELLRKERLTRESADKFVGSLKRAPNQTLDQLLNDVETKQKQAQETKQEKKQEKKQKQAQETKQEKKPTTEKKPEKQEKKQEKQVQVSDLIDSIPSLSDHDLTQLASKVRCELNKRSRAA